MNSNESEQINGETAIERYPEYNLQPTSYYANLKFRFSKRFDYVENLGLNAHDGTRKKFFILVKQDAKGRDKFGVLMYDPRSLRTIVTVAMAAKYEYKIQFVRMTNTSLTAIVKRKGKFGLYLWSYGFLFNKTYSVPTVYDELIYDKEKKRFRAVKGKLVVYYDETGHELK